MTRFCGILTLAAGLALAGCEGVNNWGWHNTASNQHSTSTTDKTAQSDAAMHDASAGQPNRINDKMPAANLSVADRDFVTAAAAGGMYEVQSSQSALFITTDDRIKNIAQHMIDDHTRANNQLKTLAQKNGFALDTVGMTTDQRNMIDSLNKLSGSDFDREYLRQQKAAHEDTIAKFQRAASSADDRDLRDWAATTLPALREHLAMITNDQSTIPPGSIGTEQ